MNPHLHCVVIDGVFDAAASGVVFRAVTGVYATAIARVQEAVRRRLLRAFVRAACCQAMTHTTWRTGSTSVAFSRWLGAHRRHRPRRAGAPGALLCQATFALERLQQLDGEQLLYQTTPGPDGRLVLTPLQLLDRLAALMPPPRIHRHGYLGVLSRTAAHRIFSRRPRMAGAGR